MLRHLHVDYPPLGPGALRQYRFNLRDVVNAGPVAIDGQQFLLVETRVAPKRYGVVQNQPPVKRPSYRARHKRRRAK